LLNLGRSLSKLRNFASVAKHAINRPARSFLHVKPMQHSAGALLRMRSDEGAIFARLMYRLLRKQKRWSTYAYAPVAKAIPESWICANSRVASGS
jgi:hypothetical protein